MNYLTIFITHVSNSREMKFQNQESYGNDKAWTVQEQVRSMHDLEIVTPMLDIMKVAWKE